MKNHENPGCIGILADIGDICDFAVSNIFIEPSDDNLMGAHRFSLQKPSQHALATSQTRGEHRGPLPHPPTIATNIGMIAIFAHRTPQKPYVVEGER